MAGEDPDWAALAELPLARSYLRFGSLSPDFQHAADAIGFGHDKSLSYHLLEKAQEEKPEFLLFALGHLAHIGSDGAMEGFIVPAYFSSAPIGTFSLYGEYPDGRGDSEGIVESFGDLLIGDWFLLVDTLYDFWFADEAAKERATEVFAWYCLTGAAYLGKDVDCAFAQAQLEEKLAKGEGILGAMTRAEAKEFVQMLLDQPLADLVDLAASGLFSALLAGEYEQNADFEQEVVHFKESLLTTPEFWTLYEDENLGLLGPTFSRNFLALKSSAGTWPSYNGNAIICGNLQSVMNFLPDKTDVIVGLTVDDVSYWSEDDQPVTIVTPELAGKPLQARVRLFSSLPFDGTVRGVVRRDAPGFDTTPDASVGEAETELSIDPLDYPFEPRSELTIPFVADPQEGLGFYVELYGEDLDGPLFTTSWDRLWSIDGIDFARSIYKNGFGTYGHWPFSLPVAEPKLAPSALFVRARIAPAGLGIPGAAVVLGSGQEGKTAANGLALFDWLDAGTVSVEVSADLYAPATPLSVELAPNALHWADVALHAVPQPQGPAGGQWEDPECVPFHWDVAPFGDQVETFLVRPFAEDHLTPLKAEKEAGAEGETNVCFKPALDLGTTLVLHVVARYVDGTLGIEGSSEPVTIVAPPAPEPVPEAGPEPALEGSPEIVEQPLGDAAAPDALASSDTASELGPESMEPCGCGDSREGSDQGCSATQETGSPMPALLLLLLGSLLGLRPGRRSFARRQKSSAQCKREWAVSLRMTDRRSGDDADQSPPRPDPCGQNQQLCGFPSLVRFHGSNRRSLRRKS
jgi:hypothetical protein